uniref:Charged multivesicular body protein 6 n=1 Tax=Ficedula albicollis TaxID=59894 RepID=U3KDM1_FICAL
MDRAVLQLKQQRDKLRQYQKRLSLGLERERALARQLLRDGKKEKAMLLLKKKRYQEQLLDKTENQISNLERMVQDIEFTQIEMKVIEGLKIGNECLNKMHQVMSIEEVERIIGETQDAVEYQRQIDELLAGSLTEEDEDAILEELNAITQEQLELPEVPSEPLPEKIPGKASSHSPGPVLSHSTGTGILRMLDSPCTALDLSEAWDDLELFPPHFPVFWSQLDEDHCSPTVPGPSEHELHRAAGPRVFLSNPKPQWMDLCGG